jgi:apolipoprotein N-acyltransferase
MQSPTIPTSSSPLAPSRAPIASWRRAAWTTAAVVFVVVFLLPWLGLGAATSAILFWFGFLLIPAVMLALVVGLVVWLRRRR